MIQSTPRAYAQAVLETALEPWLSTLRHVNRRLHEQNLVAALDDATVPLAEKKEQMRPVLADAPMAAVNLLYTLAQAGHVHLLDRIVTELEQGVERGGRGVAGLVRSAVPLTAEERQVLEQKLAGRFGEDLSLTYEVDPAIVGGLVVRVGDLVMDGSVATKLASLKEQLTKVQGSQAVRAASPGPTERGLGAGASGG